VVAGETASGKPAETLDPLSSNITVQFEHENRYMGLLWFSVYTVRFTGEYTVQASESKDNPLRVCFILPEKVRSFEDLTILLDKQPYNGASNAAAGGQLTVRLPADGKPHVVSFSYLARGRDRWQYATAPENSSRVPLIQNFTMTATTNFTNIDYPKGSKFPVKMATITAAGSTASWQYNNVRANQSMGIEMPSRPSSGPIAARMSYFAPVSLFFFTVLFTIVLLKKIPLHPMHYLFISAGFFAFHILMAYLVDLLDLEMAFWISAGVSVLLVVNYMRLVAGVRFAVTFVAVAQLAYLIGFSYAFLWKGHTGLTVVIGAIITLAILMVATALVNWNEVFASKSTGLPPAPPVGPRPTPPNP
jgi:hypothetical protein